MRLVREPIVALMGMGGFLGVGALAVLPVFSSIPDAGLLTPLRAASAEEIRVEVLSSGQTFGGVLERSSLSANEQQSVLLAFRELANPARLRTGTEVVLRFVRGPGALRGVDVAVSKDELVRLERDGYGWRSSLVETPVWTDTIAVPGIIVRDLWSSVVMNPALDIMPREDRAEVIHLMSQVFQWQLDFSQQIQRGDTYRLVFEREVRPDGSMRSGRILAAELVNSGTALHAIWFDLHGDEVGGYYDLAGESLRRAFIRAPLEYRRISSAFSMNRFHPILQVNRPHIGVDYAAASGTPVMATADGTVTRRGVNGGYGNSIEIRHANGFMTRYAHLSGYASGLRAGGRVSQGQVIGYVGMTGQATGPHLHYEMHRNGSAVDPLSIDIPAGDPIPSDARMRWTEDLTGRYAILNSLPSGSEPRIAQTEGEEGIGSDRGSQ
jgi:murein DD-endopeptidase MepM/ murein hydrolase activator NlpD